jgi:hypothetical protein
MARGPKFQSSLVSNASNLKELIVNINGK